MSTQLWLLTSEGLTEILKDWRLWFKWTFANITQHGTNTLAKRWIGAVVLRTLDPGNGSAAEPSPVCPLAST